MRRFPIFVLKLLLLALTGCASMPEPGKWNARHDQYISARAVQLPGTLAGKSGQEPVRYALGPVVNAVEVAPGVWASPSDFPRMTTEQADAIIVYEFVTPRVDRSEAWHGIGMGSALGFDGITTLLCMHHGAFERNPLFPKHLSPAVPILLPIFSTAVYFKAASTTPLSDSLITKTTMNMVTHGAAGLYNLRCAF